ncbi:hypothetical protein [Cellulomonas sp. NPDC058312]|jgi:hypothetical protein|uniref:hypothetical protein n=1 Tax=Cellulomonas sp. NPDC058312 TaxID=3346441 RepID=UPI0036E4B498
MSTSTAPRRPALRRKVVALTVAGLGIAGLGLASAAQLNLTAGALGAGTTVVASCDSDGVAVAFTNAFAAAAKGYTVTEVKLSGVAAGCAGQTVKVDLLNTDPADGSTGASLGQVTGTVAASGGSVTLAVPGSVKAADVKGVAVVIAS